jgi:ElaB/YqjD/DUF883 family membrane-anchored ribosome-binding protein
MTQNNIKTEPSKKPNDLQKEISQTRNAINEDIKALGDKVSPAHLKEEAKNALVDAKNTAVEKVVDAKDAAVDKMIEAKDVAAEKLADAKDVAVEKLTDAKNVAVEKLSEAKDVTVEKLTEAKDATIATVNETVDTVSYQARKIGGATWDFARANALPLALIGIGATWLVATRSDSETRVARKPAMRPRRADYGRAYDSSDGRPRYLADNERDLAVEDLSTSRSRSPRSDRGVTNKVKDASARVGHELSDATAKASDRAHELYDRAERSVVDTEHQLAERVSRGRDAIQATWNRARTASMDFADDNPLALAAVTMVAGVGIGLLLPSTQSENRLLGASRDRVFGEARDTAHGIGDVVRETVEQASNTLG